MKPFPKIKVEKGRRLRDEVYDSRKRCGQCDHKGSYVTGDNPFGMGLCLACLFEKEVYTRIDLPKPPDIVALIRDWAECVGNVERMQDLDLLRDRLLTAAYDLERVVS